MTERDKAKGEGSPLNPLAVTALMREYVEAADWYRRCLEDVQDGRVVRGLGEAKAGYDAALAAISSAGLEP